MIESSLELHASVCINDSDQLQALLESGKFNVNEKDTEWGYRTALHWAAEKGYVECAKQLLDFGANGTARMTFGATPAHLAAETGNLLILKLLVKSKVSVTRTDDCGDRPVDKARIYGQKSCLEYLKQVESEAMERRKTRAEELAFQKKKAAKLAAMKSKVNTVVQAVAAAAIIANPNPPKKKKGAKKNLISGPSVAAPSPAPTTDRVSSTPPPADDTKSANNDTVTNEDIVIFNSDEDIDDDPIPREDAAYLTWVIANTKDRKIERNDDNKQNENLTTTANVGKKRNSIISVSSRLSSQTPPPQSRTLTAIADVEKKKNK